MSEQARVDSVERLQTFRVQLCRSAESIETALSEAEQDIHRTRNWLHQDQQTYWKSELRKRTELYHRAKLALKRRQNEKTPLGGHYSYVDEKKAVDAAKRRLEEAEQKIANVRRWLRQLDKEADEYKAVVQRLGRYMEADVPRSLARLDQMIAALEAYFTVGVPIEERLATAGPVAGGMARAEPMPPPELAAVDYRKLRERTPEPAMLDGRPIEKPPFTELKWPRIEPAQREDILDLDLEYSPVSPLDKVVLAADCWERGRVYLERVALPSRPAGCWYVGTREGGADAEPVAVQVGEILRQRPDWAEILNLARGGLVILNGNSLEAVLDERDRQVWPPAEPKANTSAQGQSADRQDES
ncbi:MAG: hypothetical protein GXY44_04975 [Phycisphaerales bacterium]|nr:hypothetical protein [Phycisphaerales bacterium]